MEKVHQATDSLNRDNGGKEEELPIVEVFGNGLREEFFESKTNGQ